MTEVIIIALCITGIAYMYRMNKKYKNDNTSAKDEIIGYFKEQGAVTLEKGIKTKDLPKNIAKNSYLLMMVKDQTLIFEKGRYYLNSNQ